MMVSLQDQIRGYFRLVPHNDDIHRLYHEYPDGIFHIVLSGLFVDYTFLKSEYFKFIDPKAQKALLNLHEQVVALIDAFPIAHYKEILLAASDHTEDSYNDSYY
jgi:hypothetical protein